MSTTPPKTKHREVARLSRVPLPVEAAPPVEPAVRRDTPAIRTASRPGPALITAAFETIRSEDSSIWAGASFAACVRAGPLCLGAGGSAASDIHLSGQQDHPRTSLDVVATAEVPLTLAGIDVSPGVGLGYAWVRTGGTGPHQDISVTHGGWRGDARLTIGRRVVRRWSVELGLRADRIIGGDESAPALFPANQLRVGVGLRYGGS